MGLYDWEIMFDGGERQLSRQPFSEKFHSGLGNKRCCPSEWSDVAVQPLSIIFGKLWQSGGVLGDWKKGSIVPMFKKGRNEDPGNYSHTSLPRISVP